MICFKNFASIACMVIAINTHNLFALRIIAGTHGAAGNLRSEMLDRHVTYKDETTFYTGVYDGYIKSDAVNYLAQVLHENIFNDEHFTTDLETALRNSFFKTHEGYSGHNDGATVGTILVRNSVLYAANAGDVQAVFFRNNADQQAIELLSHVHTIDQELDRLKGLMGIDCSIVSTSPRDDAANLSNSLPSPRRHRTRTHSIHSSQQSSGSYEEKFCNPQELAASPRGFSSIIQCPRIQDNAITSSPRMKDDLVRRLVANGSINEFPVQSIYLIKKNDDGSGDAIKPSRSLCDHRFTPYLIPDPFITAISITEHDSFVVLATKNLWLVIEPEAIGLLVQKFLHEAQDKFQTDWITQEVADFVAKKLIKKAFSIQDIGNQTATIIFFDHECS